MRRAGAEHSTARGSARAFDHNQIIHEVWSVCFEHRIDLWIDRVASKYNISDSPSRGEHAIMEDLGAEWKPPVWGSIWIPSFEQVRSSFRCSRFSRLPLRMAGRQSCINV